MAVSLSDPNFDIREEQIRELGTLEGMSRAFSAGGNLKAPLHKVLELLESRHGVIRSAVTLLQPDTQELRIEAAVGITPHGRGASYQIGEGITGRVVASGKPIVVPQISREPLFLKRADDRKELDKKELSFFCVPVNLERQTVGALSVDLAF